MSRAYVSKLSVLLGALLCSLALLPSLAPGAAAAPLANITPSPEPPVATATATATAIPTATATAIPTATATATASPTAVPTQPTAPTEEPRWADPKVSKSASPSRAAVGDTITFSIIVTNVGNQEARDVSVTDDVPGFLEVVSASASRGAVRTSGRSVTVDIGTVNMGDEIEISVLTRVVAVPEGGAGANSVTLTTSSGSDRIPNNVAVATVEIIGQAATATATAGPTEPTVAPSPVAPSPVAQPAPRPAALPRTAMGGGAPAGSLIFIGLAAIGLGLVLRRPRKGGDTAE